MVEEPAPEEDPPVVEHYIEEEHAEAEMDAEEGAIVEMSKDEAVEANAEEVEKAKIDLTNLLKHEPNFDEWTPEQMRVFLRDQNVKGTWAKKLPQKCREVWDEMQSTANQAKNATDGIALDASQGAPVPSDVEPPDFSTWTIERKRTFLRRHEVKGIWRKHVDEKCSEVWRAERRGEKYIHTPPSLGKHTKTKFPGQSIISMSPSGTSIAVNTDGSTGPLTMSTDQFNQLALTAQRSDLKGVSDFLNNWSKSVHNVGDHVDIVAMMEQQQQVAAPPVQAPSIPAPLIPTTAVLSSAHGEREYQWVETQLTERGPRLPRVKRMSTAATPTSKRRKTSEEAAPPPDDEALTGLVEEPLSPEQHVILLQERIRELEAHNQQLMDELNAFRSAQEAK